MSRYTPLIALLILSLVHTGCITGYRAGRSLGGDDHAFTYGSYTSDLLWDALIFPISLPFAVPSYIYGAGAGVAGGTSEVVVCPNMKCKKYSDTDNDLKLVGTKGEGQKEVRFYFCKSCNTEFDLHGCRHRHCPNLKKNPYSHAVFRYRIKTKRGNRLRVYFCEKCRRLYSMPGELKNRKSESKPGQ